MPDLNHTPTPRRPKDPRIQAIVDGGNTYEVLMQAVGGPGYAGDDPNPRPLPQTTLSDFKRSGESSLQQAHQRGVQRIENALYFAFYADRFQGERDRSIGVPRDDLWWLASSGDTVLLSDKVTHHYTGIYNVNREANRVSFLDQWPDRFFLKEGLNAAGVAAKLVGNEPISITREEFRRVAVGLVTLDTPALLEDYFTQHPERAGRVEINLSCGLSLLDTDKDRFARVAAAYLARAWRLAEAEGAADTATLAARKLFVALSVAAEMAHLGGEPLGARAFLDRRRQLTARATSEDLLSQLDVDDLCRLGHAAGKAQHLEAAIEYFDRAVAADPAYEQAWWLRAIARDQREDADGAAADATEAIRLNIARAGALRAERDALDPRDRWGRSGVDGQIAAVERRRAEEYVLSFRGHFARERWDQARQAAGALIALAPQEAEGYRRMAMLEHRLGHLEEARSYATQALEREDDPDRRAALEANIRGLSA